MSDESESGGCLCGAVSYKFDKPNLISAHHCHCIDCQKSTGSGKATILMLPSKAIKMEGELKFHTTTTASGRSMNRGFCDECGSPVLGFIEEMPGMKFVRAGSLDDSSWLKIDSNFFSSSAHSWSPIDEDIPSFTHNPDKV
tara:strand:- start:331 stop:753 length:423 start_codon:yes stop_codon:yes gene_type:complete